MAGPSAPESTSSDHLLQLAKRQYRVQHLAPNRDLNLLGAPTTRMKPAFGMHMTVSQKIRSPSLMLGRFTLRM
jgi:hypothetical protein